MVDVKVEYLGNYNIDGWGELGYKFEGDAGFDLRAAISEPICLKPADLTGAFNSMERVKNYYFDGISRVLVPTGIKVELLDGWELQVRSRSGLSLKEGIFVLNSPGTVDSGYRGEVGVILCNLGQSEFIIEPGARIAQGVIKEVPKVKLIRVEKVNETDRKEGGFGSTGV